METLQTQNELIILTTDQMKNLVDKIISETKNNSKPEKEKEIYLNTKEAQEFLKIGHSTIHRFINTGKLKPVRFGRKLLFKKSDLIKESGFNFE